MERVMESCVDGFEGNPVIDFSRLLRTPGIIDSMKRLEEC